MNAQEKHKIDFVRKLILMYKSIVVMKDFIVLV